MSDFADQPKDGATFGLMDLMDFDDDCYSDDGNAHFGQTQTPKKERKKHHVVCKGCGSKMICMGGSTPATPPLSTKYRWYCNNESCGRKIIRPRSPVNGVYEETLAHFAVNDEPRKPYSCRACGAAIKKDHICPVKFFGAPPLASGTTCSPVPDFIGNLPPLTADPLDPQYLSMALPVPAAAAAPAAPAVPVPPPSLLWPVLRSAHHSPISAASPATPSSAPGQAPPCGTKPSAVRHAATAAS